MELLFATTNPAKIKRYEKGLKETNLKLVTINELGVDLEINENGKNAIENAYIKAKTYYDATKMTTIGIDQNLYIEGLPEEKRPGTHVRRVNGKRLTDEEMIEYYTNLVRRYGGDLLAKWVYGLVLYNEEGAKSYTWSKSDFILEDKPSKKRNPGYPLDSISIIPKYNKYLVDLTPEEKQKLKNNENEFADIKFILENLGGKIK